MRTRPSAQRVIATRSPTTREHLPISSPPSTWPSTAVNSVGMDLTTRQHEVLALLMQGKSNKAISRVLNLAEPTVKNHITGILKALNVTNRTEAVVKASRTFLPSLSYSYTIAGYSAFNRG
jgi:DNA-binding NarL/FixJ family response regulator